MSLPTTLTPDAIQSAAHILAERRRVGEAGPGLPAGLRPQTLDDAWAVQAAAAEQLGWEVGGWKCALPSPGKLVVAPIFAPTIWSQADCAAVPVWGTGGQVRIEPELAFVLSHDLPARAQPWLEGDVDAAVARTHLALELIGSRYAEGFEPTFEDKLADGLVNQGLFLGPQVDGEAARQASAFHVQLSWSAHEQGLAGQHPDGLPRRGLYWLAEFLRSRGLGLRAGQVVITGSYAGAPWVPLGQNVTVRHGELGQATLCLQQMAGTTQAKA
jgi:2-keto-4-pentenoate hydratase